MDTLEKYLKECIDVGIIDFSIRASECSDGEIVFYIHPDGKDGDTLDFSVKGNVLSESKHVTKA